jgi:hypothetical protein
MDSSKNCCPFVTKLCSVTKLGDLTVRIWIANPDADTNPGILPINGYHVLYNIVI